MVELCPDGGQRRRVDTKDVAAAVFVDEWPEWLTGGESVTEATASASGKRLGVHYPAEGRVFWGQFIDCVFIYDDGDLVLQPEYWITDDEEPGRDVDVDPRPDGCVFCDEATGDYLTWSKDGTVTLHGAVVRQCHMPMTGSDDDRRRAIFQHKLSVQVEWK